MHTNLDSNHTGLYRMVWEKSIQQNAVYLKAAPASPGEWGVS